MSTYRERRLAKAERLRDWATKREAKARAGFAAAHRIADGIPFGQPILVGHHSEKHHRRDIARIDSGMRSGIENSDKANEFLARADNIEAAADRAIYSDDPDALDALTAKLTELESKRERMARCNRAYRAYTATKATPAARAKAAEALAVEGFRDPEGLRAEIETRYTWERKGPFPPYVLSNLGGVITNTRKRIQDVKSRQARAADVESAGGFKITRGASGCCRVEFSEKPDRSILTALKAAGFRWGAGCWMGVTAALPDCVVELESEAAEILHADMGNAVDFDGEGNNR